MVCGLQRIDRISPVVCDWGTRENEASTVCALETERKAHTRCFGISAQGPDRRRQPAPLQPSNPGLCCTDACNHFGLRWLRCRTGTDHCLNQRILLAERRVLCLQHGLTVVIRSEAVAGRSHQLWRWSRTRDHLRRPSLRLKGRGFPSREGTLNPAHLIDEIVEFF